MKPARSPRFQSAALRASIASISAWGFPGLTFGAAQANASAAPRPQQQCRMSIASPFVRGTPQRTLSHARRNPAAGESSGAAARRCEATAPGRRIPVGPMELVNGLRYDGARLADSYRALKPYTIQPMVAKGNGWDGRPSKTFRGSASRRWLEPSDRRSRGVRSTCSSGDASSSPSSFRPASPWPWAAASRPSSWLSVSPAFSSSPASAVAPPSARASWARVWAASRVPAGTSAPSSRSQASCSPKNRWARASDDLSSAGCRWAWPIAYLGNAATQVDDGRLRRCDEHPRDRVTSQLDNGTYEDLRSRPYDATEPFHPRRPGPAGCGAR